MRTSALRLSVVYAASFATALVALVFVIYLLTARYINAEVDTVIERDARGMLDAYGRSGTRGIISELNLRASTFSRINAVYLLTDSEGFVIAGNLPAWPVMRGREGPWVEFEIELREGGVETDRPVKAVKAARSRHMIGVEDGEVVPSCFEFSRRHFRVVSSLDRDTKVSLPRSKFSLTS